MGREYDSDIIFESESEPNSDSDSNAYSGSGSGSGSGSDSDSDSGRHVYSTLTRRGVSPFKQRRQTNTNPPANAKEISKYTMQGVDPWLERSNDIPVVDNRHTYVANMRRFTYTQEKDDKKWSRSGTQPLQILAEHMTGMTPTRIAQFWQQHRYYYEKNSNARDQGGGGTMPSVTPRAETLVSLLITH